MAMTVKLKLLLIWIFVVVVIGLAAHHFLSGAVCTIQNMVAMEVACSPVVVKLGSQACSSHF
jgi:hypothetical protein